MSPTVLLVVYCALILLASLAGGWIPLMIRLTHRRMQAAVSLVAGVMLGVGLLHMLPHAVMEAPDSLHAIFTWTLAGFLVMFFIERFFCFHHHDVPSLDPTEALEEEHQEAHHQDAHAAGTCAHVRSDSHRLTWTGALVGLTLHTVIAGIALAASVEAETHGGLVALAGLGTFLVIFLHKPFDAMTISTLMTIGAWSRPARHLVNGLFALMVPVGVILFHLGLGHIHAGGNLVSYALAFSAGTFLCIAMSDLLPELQFHAHDRAVLSVALLLGLSVAWVIGAIEKGSHAHQHEGHAAHVETRAHEGERETEHPEDVHEHENQAADQDEHDH
jgi:zinc and cadmium transporter